MIANAEVNRDRSEGIELALYEIVPLRLVVVGFVRRRVSVLGLVQIVLINERGGAEIAQVPVKLSVVFLCAGGDGRHNHVAAIARIAGDGERPLDESGIRLVAWLIFRSQRAAGNSDQDQDQESAPALIQTHLTDVRFRMLRAFFLLGYVPEAAPASILQFIRPWSSVQFDAGFLPGAGTGWRRNSTILT